MQTSGRKKHCTILSDLLVGLIVRLKDVFQGLNTPRGNGPQWEMSLFSQRNLSDSLCISFSSSLNFLLLKEVLVDTAQSPRT